MAERDLAETPIKTGRASIGRAQTHHNGRGGVSPRPTRTRQALRAQPGGLRLPIAVKYAGITGILLVLCMWILGRSLLTLSLYTVEGEINDKGIKAAVLVASLIDPFWTRDDLTNDQRQAAAEGLEKELSTFLKDPGAAGVDFVESGVGFAGAEQLVMGADGLDATVVDDDDAIGDVERAETVSDDEGRPATGEVA